MRKILQCECGSTEHIMLIEEDEDIVYISIHLSKLPLLKRFKRAFNYILGYRSVYGDFDEIITSRTALKNLL